MPHYEKSPFVGMCKCGRKIIKKFATKCAKCRKKSKNRYVYSPIGMDIVA